MGKDVFISYKSEEYNDAVWLTEMLTKEGISTWMAPRDIPSGSSYAREITAAIKGCKVFVLVLSNAAQTSQWIPKEIDNAINENKLILPFMVEQCELNDEFKFFLSNIQFKEAYKNRKNALSELIDEIKEHLRKFPDEETDAEEQENEELTDDTPTVTEEKKAKKEKKKKEKKQKKPSDNGTDGKKKKLKKLLKIVGAILGSIAAVYLIAFIIIMVYAFRSTVVAGTEFYLDATTINLENVTVTEEDIKELSEFDEILTLSLKNCTISVPEIDLSQLTSLWELRLTDCNLTEEQLKSIDLSLFPKLKELDISGNGDITYIPRYELIKENLTVLNVSDTGITDISFISGTKNLMSLEVNGLGIESLAPLNECIYLEELKAADNRLTDIEGLSNCTILRAVSIPGNAVSDISVLEKSAATLEEIDISSNFIEDISPLSKCTEIKTFIAENNSITSLEALSESAYLNYLDVSGNKIDSLDFVTTDSIYLLDISDNLFTDELYCLFSKTRGVMIFAADNALTDILLYDDCTYESIDLSGNDVSYISPLSENPCISKLTVEYNEELDFSDVCTAAAELTVINCPLDTRVQLEQLSNGRIIFEDRQ